MSRGWLRRCRHRGLFFWTWDTPRSDATLAGVSDANYVKVHPTIDPGKLCKFNYSRSDLDKWCTNPQICSHLGKLGLLILHIISMKKQNQRIQYHGWIAIHGSLGDFRGSNRWPNDQNWCCKRCLLEAVVLWLLGCGVRWVGFVLYWTCESIQS